MRRSLIAVLWPAAVAASLAGSSAVAAAQRSAAESLQQAVEPGFGPVYEALAGHCGNCHVVGGADGPWALNRTPTETSFPECLSAPAQARERCATYHELVDEPGPGIPAWVDTAVPSDSDLYGQACVQGVSFHLGNSLPAEPDEAFCKLLLDWIDAGAPY